jgi:hypothetical protein
MTVFLQDALLNLNKYTVTVTVTVMVTGYVTVTVTMMEHSGRNWPVTWKYC